MYLSETPPPLMPIHRLTTDTFKKVVKVSPSGIYHAPDAENRPGPAKLLRPRGPAACAEVSTAYLEKEGQADNEMRLINMTKNTEMWNNSIREHTVTPTIHTSSLYIICDIVPQQAPSQTTRCCRGEWDPTHQPNKHGYLQLCL